MANYSVEFKKAAVQKFLSRGSRSAKDVCDELGVGNSCIYFWCKKYGKSMSMKPIEKRPQDRTAAEKLKAVIDYEKLDPEKQGEFLRREGLHSDHIEDWKRCMEAGLEPDVGTKLSRSERAQLRAENKALERDLNKKDKALAEVTALLVLKKKADLLWGTGENK